MTDEFYTKYPERLLPYIVKYITPDDDLVEPSCGDGAFLNLLDFTVCYDIVNKLSEDNSNVMSIFEQRNFLEVDDLPEDLVYVGNPPFGKNSKLAIDFCRHCCELKAKYIMFILPIVFKQQKYQNKAFDTRYHLLEQVHYNEFVKDGKTIVVECVFQVWKRDDIRSRQSTTTTTSSLSSTKPLYFTYIAKRLVGTLNPHDERVFSIRRVGSATPELTKGIHTSLEDHYVIKLNDNIDINQFITTYNNFKFVLSPSTKQKHITQQLLNKQINTFNLNNNSTTPSGN